VVGLLLGVLGVGGVLYPVSRSSYPQPYVVNPNIC
jgi:hypothetical protein